MARDYTANPRGGDAINNPVKTGGTELNTGDMHINQKPDIDMDGNPFAHRGEKLAAVDTHIDQSYLEALSFAEEPICIRIEKSTAKNPPKTVPCWVDGKGAEVYADGKWWTLGFLPIGQPIITRRKYVEVIARAKTDTVDTEHAGESMEESAFIDNKVRLHTSALYPFSVIRDNNPRGGDWLTKVMAEY